MKKFTIVASVAFGALVIMTVVLCSLKINP